MQLTVRQPSASEDAKHYTTDRLRSEYLIETVFAPDDAILTYSHFDRIIAGGVMCLNGAAARMVQTGDKIILMAYAQVTPEEASELRPTVLFVDEKNKVTKVTNYEKHGEIG